jgi:hypothetical protein
MDAWTMSMLRDGRRGFRSRTSASNFVIAQGDLLRDRAFLFPLSRRRSRQERRSSLSSSHAARHRWLPSARRSQRARTRGHRAARGRSSTGRLPHFRNWDSRVRKTSRRAARLI